mgnify:CR=1 FL=1
MRLASRKSLTSQGLFREREAMMLMHQAGNKYDRIPATAASLQPSHIWSLTSNMRLASWTPLTSQGLFRER